MSSVGVRDGDVRMGTPVMGRGRAFLAYSITQGGKDRQGVNGRA